MRRTIISIMLLVAMGVVGLGTTSQAESTSRVQNHEQIVKFWTKARVAKAVSRDFVRNPTTGKYLEKNRRFDSGYVTGASWESGGEVQGTTGKVLFSMGSRYYVCTANVVGDGVAGRSIISTAAHCVFDEVNGVFADNWMFVPDYDNQPVALTGDGSFCDSTLYGCWTAQATIVSNNYATAGSFNNQAVLSDYAFVAVEQGGKSLTHLDVEVGSQPIAFAEEDFEINIWSFGYPAARKYKGADLTYCNGLLYFDVRMDYQTYQLGCNMTGGASGGPWFKDFSNEGITAGEGTQFSVNSYGYSNSKNMYGPIFGTETESMFNTAQTMTVNTIFGS